MTTSYDYGKDAGPQIGDNLLAQIDYTANEVLRAEEEVARTETEAAAARERLRDLTERQLPELMDSASVKELTTASDLKVKLKDGVSASLSEGRKPKAIEWLREKGHPYLIKDSLGIPLATGQGHIAAGIAILLGHLADNHRRLRQTYADNENVLAALSYIASANFSVVHETDVNTTSLIALIRQLLADGKVNQDDLDLLGARHFKKAEVRTVKAASA